MVKSKYKYLVQIIVALKYKYVPPLDILMHLMSSSFLGGDIDSGAPFLGIAL